MRWDDLPVEFRELAESVLTDAELRAMRVRCSGASELVGYRRIGRVLGISRDAARARVESAERKIAAALAAAERRDVG